MNATTKPVSEALSDVAEYHIPAGQAMEIHKPRQEIANANAPMTPMEMVGRALEMGVSAEILKQMMDLRDREEANQARKAFAEAFAAFKSEAIVIIRNKKVTDGPLKNKSYAELFSFVDAVTPALSKHGLSASWDITRDEKDWIEVTCTIEHVLGHTKSVSMGGPPDSGGAKNAIQARASTVSYLERHTLKAACGVAEQGDDSDGKAQAGPVGPISAEQAEIIRKLIEDNGRDIEKFCAYFKIEAIPDLPANQFERAITALSKKAVQ